MELLQTVLIAIASIFILVTVHEFGHFWVARRCGIKVLRFSIGFGKPLYCWQDRHGTEFVVAAIPLGGYVKMLDEREGDVPDDELEYAFNRKPVEHRMATVAAGPIANFILAIIAYWCVFMNGVSGYAPIVGDVEPDSIAAQAGLINGDEIIAVDGEETPTWEALHLRLLQRIGESGEILVKIKLPESGRVEERSLRIENWLAGEEAVDLVAGLGMSLYRPSLPPQLEQVIEDTPAQRAGLQAGDVIIGTDGLAFDDWFKWSDYVKARPGQALSLRYERNGEQITTTVTPAEKLDEDGKPYGQVGVQVKIAADWPQWPEGSERVFSYNPAQAMIAALERTWSMSLFTLESIKKMIKGLISPKNLSGPITIAKVATASAKSGVEAYISFLALLSISLGVLNLLPIPVLDGGHLMYGLVEWLIGRPVPEKVQMIGYQVGFVLIISLMMFALYNDISRL